MRMMKRLLLGVGLMAVSAGVTAAAPAVVQTDLTLRSGPGPRYAAIATLPAGTTVDVRTCTSRWCRVAFEGGQGFANRAYLAFGSAAVVPGYEYGPDYGYYDPGYYGDDYAYYGDDGYYPYGYGGFGFAFRGGHRHGHWADRDHDHDRGNHHNRMSSFSPNNPSVTSRSFAPRNNVAPQANHGIRSGQSFSRPNFSANRPSGTVGAGAPMAHNPAPMAHSTVGAGGPTGAAHIGGSGGGISHSGGGGGGGRHH